MRVMGVDFGERRIGLALSDASGVLARPFKTLEAGATFDETVARLAREVEALQIEQELSLVVVGLPLRLDGSPDEQTPRVNAFVEALRNSTSVPVAMQDERLSSLEAESRLALTERDWRKRKLRLDAAAAAVILQDYLDRAGSPPATANTASEGPE
jgi:putative holliday junction resolvase